MEWGRWVLAVHDQAGLREIRRKPIAYACVVK